MDNFTRKCLLVGTISLALLAADTLFWTLMDLTSDWDMYEQHLLMHEEMDKQQLVHPTMLSEEIKNRRNHVKLQLNLKAFFEEVLTLAVQLIRHTF